MSKNKPSDFGKAVPENVLANLKVLIVASRFNEKHVDHLLARCVEKLTQAGLKEHQIVIKRVPGANEIPAAIDFVLNKNHHCKAAIALGTVIAGETPHHEIIAHATAGALQRIALDWRVPVINGIIVTNNEAQADARIFGEQDRGTEFANAALEMITLFNS